MWGYKMTMLGRKILAIICLVMFGYQLISSFIAAGNKKKKINIYVELLTSICGIVFVSNNF